RDFGTGVPNRQTQRIQASPVRGERLCPRRRCLFFFFKQKTAYEIGLGIPAEPLFRSFISGRLATKSNQIKQLIRNGRSASLQRTFKKSFTSFSHSTRNKTRDGLIRVRNIRALNGRFNTSITHAYSIVIGSKHITL